jgi:CRP-like cAMP-binding protein
MFEENANVQEIVRRVRSISSVFDEIPDAVIHKLLPQVRQYLPGTVLMRENERDDPSFYVLIRGKIGISIDGFRISDFSGFRVFGEAGFIGEPRTASVTVEETIQAIRISPSDVEAFPCEVRGVFYRNLLREVTRKMRSINGRYVQSLREMADEHPHILGERVMEIV